MVLGLDVALNPALFQVQIVLKALVSGICNKFCILLAVVPGQRVHEFAEGSVIRAVRKHFDPGDILTVDRNLDVVARLQLPIPHMVFLHPHKCGIRICFGVAVPGCSHDLQGLL